MLFGWIRLRPGTKKVRCEIKRKDTANYKKLPNTLRELDPSYGMLIKELGKR